VSARAVGGATPGGGTWDAAERRARAQVDILIVNCSLFNPTPSLASMVVKHFRMRPSVITYNLSGMGCSAGLIAIGLAQELLQARARTRGLSLPLAGLGSAGRAGSACETAGSGRSMRLCRACEQ